MYLEIIQEVVNIRLEFLLYIEKISRYRIEKNIILLVSLIIRQNKEYATMSTTVYLNPFVKAGYVFRCFDNDANKQYNIFFNPISGDFFIYSKNSNLIFTTSCIISKYIVIFLNLS